MTIEKNVIPLSENISDDPKKFLVIGWTVVLLGLAIFIFWAAFAPLDKGVPAIGNVAISGNKKSVQSSVEGIITHIFVKNGDPVSAGQTLIQLSPLQSQALVKSLSEQYDNLLITQQRLYAELNQQTSFKLNNNEKYYSSTENREKLLLQQNRLLNEKSTELISEINGYKAAIDGITGRLTHLKRSIQNKKSQISNLQNQLNDLQILANEGYIPRHRYQEMIRELAENNNQLNETFGQISALEKQKLEYEQRILQRNANFHQLARTELNKIQLQISETEKQLIIETDKLAKMAIIAPISGTVMDLSVFTQGGFVKTGQTLMDIVPADHQLVIEARLAPHLIDKVTPGLPVDLIFSAFNQNTTPKIPGEVTIISADRLIDERTTEPYYQVLINIKDYTLLADNKNKLKAGMPVDVFIKTGDRSLLNYLFKPVLDRLHTSLTEE
ncbi:HlyD family type I secretion periplasmic adaptor subunit [Proteus mirabilis]|uniref:HlyD family type I secretion periplasmic adaptor subunit n=1 Tax=Proteus mirabilis TaxID=584 RepID=UPI001A22D840|nr:HlyD family type I secretion periplasmic adaptor subunit [Proteus mirabilis]MBI6253092.1 HlyD family type I secretion periplasmic adaptor subunit [Proteus mirabilis]MBI6291360.1 HlyD family type I secretion periplasmic adaptor subunit [Proteus mirabilis]MDC5886794.1 HlyD family type I secretion periplasmic adaptor subunit [Proteus mirabilis]MDC5893935.1 HlyD family type I secretion periplasmic adaptor subunit [Proteus mirabilis]MDC5904391.1 HlyD family type I secretion periplasmic adaptor s